MDGQRAHESLAVVSVLTNEVHTTGGIGENGGLLTEGFSKEGNCLITKFAGHLKRKRMWGLLTVRFRYYPGMRLLHSPETLHCIASDLPHSLKFERVSNLVEIVTIQGRSMVENDTRL